MRLINNGQSALTLMYTPPVVNGRTWEVRCPVGMLGDHLLIKRFTSVHAFEGYIVKAQELGMVAIWSSPFIVTLERAK